jgi:hypothetical protein
MKVYKVMSLDLLARIITGFVFLLISGLIFIPLLLDVSHEAKSVLSATFSVLLLAAIIFVSWALSPKKYILTDHHLIIKRTIASREINLKEITGVRLLAKEELKGLIRTFGIGGLFGYVGKFYNKKLGHLSFYATSRKGLILIETIKKEKIVISPSDAQFQQDLLSRIKPV